MQRFVVPLSHNRGRDPWVEYVLPDESLPRCPAPPTPVEVRAEAKPADAAIWFAPGAADLSRLPEKAGFFEDAWAGISSGEWPDSKKKTKRKPSGKPEFRDLGLALHREQEAILQEVRNEGFVWLGGEDHDGHYVPAFTELGHRSKVAGAHVIRRIVAMTDRRPMSGMMKERVVREIRKEAALISDYVVLNSRVRGCIRVDNDMTFDSWNDVHNWLFWLLEEGTIPFLPHLAVCKRSVDGSVVRPHFFILLPVGDEVHWDKRKRGGQRGLFRAVANGWTRALRGDPGGIKNSLKIKSPTAPRMLVGIFNQSRYASLAEMAESLDCRRFDDRRAATDDSDLPAEISNEVFTETRRLAWPAVAKLADMGDPRYPKWVANRDAFRNGLFHSLIPAALDRWSGDTAPNSIRAVVWHVCRRVARDWDPNRVSPPPDRGVMGLPDKMELTAKQVASGQWSSAKRLSETLDAMADEIDRIEGTGHAARKADLIKTTKWSRATVNRRFDDAVVLAYYRAQPVSGKKVITPAARNSDEQADVAADRELRLGAILLPIPVNNQVERTNRSEPISGELRKSANPAIIDSFLVNRGSVDLTGFRSNPRADELPGRSIDLATRRCVDAPLQGNRGGHVLGTSVIAGTSRLEPMPGDPTEPARNCFASDRGGIDLGRRHDSCGERVDREWTGILRFGQSTVVQRDEAGSAGSIKHFECSSSPNVTCWAHGELPQLARACRSQSPTSWPRHSCCRKTVRPWSAPARSRANQKSST